MAKLVGHIEERGAENIRLHDDDATQVLDWLPEASIDHIDLLYPDPWPKRKHWKRRFVSKVNLDRFARVLKPGGVFCFASDIDTYVNWTLLHCRDHAAFDWTAENASDWLTPYPGWPSTRYEAKARREGRKSAYLTFRRGLKGRNLELCARLRCRLTVFRSSSAALKKVLERLSVRRIGVPSAPNRAQRSRPGSMSGASGKTRDTSSERILRI